MLTHVFVNKRNFIHRSLCISQWFRNSIHSLSFNSCFFVSNFSFFFFFCAELCWKGRKEGEDKLRSLM